MSKKKSRLAASFNVQSPIFVPIWRRVALVAFTGLWAVLELSLGQPLWALVFGGVALYLAHQFFIAFDPKDPSDE